MRVEKSQVDGAALILLTRLTERSCVFKVVGQLSFPLVTVLENKDCVCTIRIRFYFHCKIFQKAFGRLVYFTLRRMTSNWMRMTSL